MHERHCRFQQRCSLLLTRQQGLTLLELLLVLTIAGCLATVGLRAYRQSQQRPALLLIRSDVTTIYAALERYYFAMGCNPQPDGTFRGSVTPDISLLDQYQDGVALPTSRLPIVSHYTAAIVKTTDKASNGKYVYRLKVSAIIAANAPLAAEQYAKLLQAGLLNKQVLSWQMLPQAQPDHSLSVLWLLEEKQRGFRELAGGGQDHQCVG